MFARRKREGVFAMTEPDLEAKFLPILEEPPALSSLPSCLENVLHCFEKFKFLHSNTLDDIHK